MLTSPSILVSLPLLSRTALDVVISQVSVTLSKYPRQATYKDKRFVLVQFWRFQYVPLVRQYIMAETHAGGICLPRDDLEAKER